MLTVTKNNFEQDVLQADKPVLVDFWAPWCGYCRRIAPVVDRLDQEYGDQLLTGKLNVDEQPDLAEEFQVETIPTLLLFQGGRQKAEPLIAPGSKAEIVDWLRENGAL